MQRRMMLLVVLAAVLTACTTSTPEPVPTTSPTTTETAPTAAPSTAPSTAAPGRMAVVLAPDPALTAAAAEIGVRSIATTLREEAELRVVTADEVSFVEDLASFFATEGYDLVCLVGSGAEEAVRRVAPSAPGTRFCVAPSSATDLPGNVLPIDVRMQELGYVAGIALAADGVAGPVGVLSGQTTYQPARLQAGLQAGLAAGGAGGVAVQPVGPLRDVEGTVEAAGDLLEVGTDGVLSLTGALDATVRDVLVEEPVATPTEPATEQATDAPTEPIPTASPTEAPPRFAGLVAGPEARPEEDGAELPELLLTVLELHLEEAVAIAVDRHLGTWDVAPASVGLADGAFRVDVGTSPRARAVATAVEDAVTGIREGAIEVPSS